MRDEDRERADLIKELVALRRQVVALEQAESRSHRSSEAWRDLWAQYEAIIEAFDGYIYICSQNFEVEFMNQRFIERTGYYPLGQKCYRALHDLEQPCPWCLNEKVFRGETVRWPMPGTIRPFWQRSAASSWKWGATAWPGWAWRWTMPPKRCSRWPRG